MELKKLKEVESFFFDEKSKKLMNTDTKEFIFRTNKYALAGHDKMMECELIFLEENKSEPKTIRIAIENGEVEVEYYDFRGRDCDNDTDFRLVNVASRLRNINTKQK